MEEVEETQEEVNMSDIDPIAECNPTLSEILVEFDDNELDIELHSECSPILTEEILVEVNNLEITSGGKIALYLSSYKPLAGATIHTNAKRIFMDGEYSDSSTGIFAQPRNSEQIGFWKTSIRAMEQLEILNGARISTTRKGLGRTNLQVQSPFITINGDSAARAGNKSNAIFLPTGIFSQNHESAEPGRAGSITMSGIEKLKLHNGGRISTTINDDFLEDSHLFRGGDITIQADTIMIDRSNYSQATGIFAQNHDSSFASNPGDIFLDSVGELLLIDGGRISVSTFSGGRGSDLTVNANEIYIDQQNTDFATGLFAQKFFRCR